MKMAMIGGVVCFVSLSACAAITERTNLSTEQQICIATNAAAVIQDEATADLPMIEKIGFVAAACEIDLNALIQGTIQTAILAADKAE